MTENELKDKHFFDINRLEIDLLRVIRRQFRCTDERLSQVLRFHMISLWDSFFWNKYLFINASTQS